MASMTEPTLEFWVSDSVYNLPLASCDLQRALIVRVLEPYRDGLEHSMEETYKPESMSWRIFRNDLWDQIESPVSKVIDRIIEGDLIDLTDGLWIINDTDRGEDDKYSGRIAMVVAPCKETAAAWLAKKHWGRLEGYLEHLEPLNMLSSPQGVIAYGSWG